MDYILLEPDEIVETNRWFRNSVMSNSIESRKVTRHFAGGDSSGGIEYTLNCQYGKFMVMFPDKERWNERIPNLFSLNPKGSDYTSDVEINIPVGLNRSVGGCFVKNTDEILICNRGVFTSYKSSIRKEISLQHFKDSIIHVQDGDRESDIIMIANLTESDFIDQLALFTKELKKLKFKIKVEIQNNNPHY